MFYYVVVVMYDLGFKLFGLGLVGFFCFESVISVGGIIMVSGCIMIFIELLFS